MKRALLAALLALAAPAHATCPHMTDGWAQTWSGPIQSASYDRYAQVLYLVSATQTVAAFSGVPFGVMQSLTRAQNPYQFYATRILNTYHQVLITEKENCPVLTEDGLYVWVN